MNRRVLSLGAVVVACWMVAPVGWGQGRDMQIDPSPFDFGWSPVDSKIYADFSVRNTSQGSIPVTEIEPTCGCTATTFTPGVLGPGETMMVGIAFDTRGYDGERFYKKTKLRTDRSNDDLWLNVRGHVRDASAPLRPEGDGILSFLPNSQAIQTVTFKNHGTEPLNLSLFQAPAGWAAVRLPPNPVSPGASIQVGVEVFGSLEEQRETSFTLRAQGESVPHHLTVVVRSGPVRTRPRIRPAAPGQMN